MIMGAEPSIRCALNDLRAEFPVCERLAYLNAGTNGPVPRRAVEAAGESMRRQAAEGRGDSASFEVNGQRIDLLRDRIAGLFGCASAELALTGSTTDGVNVVLNALDLGPGDEILTSDEEHPGVLAPLGGLRERRGVEVRVVPFDRLGEEVRPETKLVACSHVSWVNGAVVDAGALAASDALVLLDGAQGLGAVPTRVSELGCDFYAASGQKWLCGPNGVGYLYVRGELAATLPAAWPNYGVLEDSTRALELDLHPDARRFAMGFPAAHQVEWALAALDVLEDERARRAPGARHRVGRQPRLGARATRRAARALDAGVLGGWRPGGDGGPAAVGGDHRPRTCPAAGTCGPRWAVGRARTSWTGWWRWPEGASRCEVPRKPPQSASTTMPNTIAATVVATPAAPTTANTAASPTRPERPSSSARTPPRIANPKAAGTPIPAASEAQTTVSSASVSTIVAIMPRTPPWPPGRRGAPAARTAPPRRPR